jgi:hypothetical protein
LFPEQLCKVFTALSGVTSANDSDTAIMKCSGITNHEEDSWRTWIAKQ